MSYCGPGVCQKGAVSFLLCLCHLLCPIADRESVRRVQSLFCCVCVICYVLLWTGSLSQGCSLFSVVFVSFVMSYCGPGVCQKGAVSFLLCLCHLLCPIVDRESVTRVQSLFCCVCVICYVLLWTGSLSQGCSLFSAVFVSFVMFYCGPGVCHKGAVSFLLCLCHLLCPIVDRESVTRVQSLFCCVCVICDIYVTVPCSGNTLGVSSCSGYTCQVC